MNIQKFSPKSLRDFFGQELIKKRLKILFDKYDKNQTLPASFFIYGPVGMGKRTLAKILANRIKRKIFWLDDISTSYDLISIMLSGLPDNVFCFYNLENIDTKIQSFLARVLKEKSLEFIIGGGKNIKVNLEKLVVVGISQRASQVSKNLIENFYEIFHLEKYKIREIKKIISSIAKKQKINIDNEALWEIAHCSRKNPQKALALLNKINDFAENYKKENITFSLVQKALKELGIDRIGLEKFDRDLLKTIIEKFSGGPVGIENYAAKLGESPWNIEEVHEPYLIEIGFLKRSARGRSVSREAHEYLGYQYSVGKTIGKLKTNKSLRNQKKLF